MAMNDIERHMTSIREQASKRYPGVQSEDMCYVIEHIQTLITPDIEIHAVPIEGTEWSQHLSPGLVKAHYERKRMGKSSYLIVIQSGFNFPKPTYFHCHCDLENEGKALNTTQTDKIRTLAFDPDGTPLQSLMDQIDELLKALHRSRTRKNSWTCHLQYKEEVDVARLDIFRAIDDLCKYVKAV